MERMYEIWVLGENEDHSINDFEIFLDCTNDEDSASTKFERFLSSFDNPKHLDALTSATPRARLVLEVVENGECIDIIEEETIK